MDTSQPQTPLSSVPRKRINLKLGLVTACVAFVALAAISGSVTGAMTPSQGRIADTYTPIEEPATEGKESLQLKSIKFKREETPVSKTSDCNNGTIKGVSEPIILWAVNPDPGQTVAGDGKIKIWYNDEHPLTLGSGTVSDPSTHHVVDPNIGDASAHDSNNFPFYPALFLTDITSNPNDKSGDAQNGGTPHKPSEVWGNWQQLNAAHNLPPNNLILPSGADPFPATSNITFDSSSYMRRSRETAHGAEIIWDVSKLGLTPGKTYRAQFIIHDGDREGDIGEGCVTIKS